MKKLLFIIVMMILPMLANAQVEFSKFKLSRDEPFGAFPGRKMLNTKFKVTADRDLKYVLVDYYIVTLLVTSFQVLREVLNQTIKNLLSLKEWNVQVHSK